MDRVYSLVASQSPRHQLRFERQPSLLDCADTSDLEDFFFDACSSLGGTSPVANNVSRTNSPRIGSATPEDIDRRAEIFIANSHRHFRLERQLALQPGLSCSGKPSAGWSPRPSPISPSSYFNFMSKGSAVRSPARPPPFSTAIEFTPARPTSSSIKYPGPVPPLEKGRPTVMIHKPLAFYHRSMLARETPKYIAVHSAARLGSADRWSPLSFSSRAEERFRS